MIPPATKERILQALSAFDRSRPTGWERRNKYAVRHDGKLYPVKDIIALATGTPKSRFSGGRAANGYLESRGFEIVRLAELPPADSQEGSDA